MMNQNLKRNGKPAAKQKAKKNAKRGAAPSSTQHSNQSKLAKLTRLELVELIYDIRRDNVALERRCRELELQVARLEQLEALSGLGTQIADFGQRLDDTSTGLGTQLADIEQVLMDMRNSVRVDEESEGALRAAPADHYAEAPAQDRFDRRYEEQRYDDRAGYRQPSRYDEREDQRSLYYEEEQRRGGDRYGYRPPEARPESRYEERRPAPAEYDYGRPVEAANSPAERRAARRRRARSEYRPEEHPERWTGE